MIDIGTKMNHCSDGRPHEDSPNNFHNQGVKPKIKNCLCTEENGAPLLCLNNQNGITLHNEEFSSNQSHASCSFSGSQSSSSLTPSQSLLCLNQVHVDKRNGEYSGEKCSAKGRTLSSEENDLRNHDKKRKTGYFIDSESSSGNDGEESLSGDDFCIYTYKGDQFADLPNSFLSVDMVLSRGNESLRENHRKANHRRGADDQDRHNLGSSPEMDYLEMDFDPGPSLEQDSEEDLNGLERVVSCNSLLELPSEIFNNDKNEKQMNKLSATPERGDNGKEFQPGSTKNTLQCPLKSLNEVSDCNSNSFNRTKGFLDSCCGSFSTVDEDSANCNITNGEVKEEQLENTNENKMADKKVLDGIMLWSEQEAISKLMTFASSELSCAETAVINAMLVLKMKVSIKDVKLGISTLTNSKAASIPEYLISRSYAGFAQENLIRGIHHASHGLLFARFFQMHPRRDIVLTSWLNHWMKKGAVPIVTMNVQRNSDTEESTADIRHHQMIFGVSNKGIYLTNPLECLQEEELWSRFVSPILKIKRSDIVSRWSPETNLKPLMFQSDERWKKMNVLGQVVNIIREFSNSGEQGKFLTQHIFIPASSGVTLVINRHSPSYRELISAEDLPLLSKSPSE